MKKALISLLVVFLIINHSFSQGQLWGLTGSGGSNNLGTVFNVNADGTGYQSTSLVDVTQGAFPNGNLTQAPNGKLYGLTPGGGKLDFQSSYLGTLFEFDPLTRVYQKKFEFDSINGSVPINSLTLASNGKLYGMTQGGGANSNGVIFEYDPATNLLTKKFDFESITTGASPFGSLIFASNGKLYGMTNSGGANSVGVIFEFDPSNGNYVKKFDFEESTGRYPYGQLLEANNGKFYGMTIAGGQNGQGVLFQYDLVNNSYTKLIDFKSDIIGSYPTGDLTQASNNKLYGMTSRGGVNDNGTIFEFDLVSLEIAKKIDFEASTTGNEPRGSLLQSSNGKLYGMTLSGGVNNLGVLFEFNPANGAFSKKFDFAQTTGAEPHGSLIFVNAPVRQDQTITFDPIPVKKYGDAPFLLSAASTSGLPVTFAASDSTIVSISGHTATILKAGTVTIKASQSGNASYNPAPDVSRTLVINKAKQTITFESLDARRVGDPPFTLSAFSSSGLQISYTSSNPKVATISGNIVTILKKGETTITASQPGNESYFAAASVSQKLIVKAKRSGGGDDEDEDDNSCIQVYPNPSSAWVTITLGSNGKEKLISILKSDGNLIAKWQMTASELRFFVGDYQPNTYFINVQIGGSVKTIRFVKM